MGVVVVGAARLLARRLMALPFLQKIDVSGVRKLMSIVQLIFLLLGLGDALEVLSCEHEILLDKLEVLLKAVDLRDDPFQIQLPPHILL